MARTAEKTESLIAEDPAMADALSVVLAQCEETGTVEWGDVREDISSGQWGRLIEKGVLIDADGGFVLDDPEAVREAVGESDSIVASAPAGDDDEESSWSVYDKAAAVATLGLFAGYSMAPVRNLIGGTIDLLLGPLDAALPFYMVVLVLAMFTGLYSTILQANLMNMERMSEYQERMKEIQERRKKAKERGDDEALQRIKDEQMDAMGDQLGMFKEQFRPMVWIMVITIPVFLWMYWKILPGGGGVLPAENSIVVPLAGEVTWQQGVAGPIQAWIVWYFVCSMGFTQIIRKSLNIQTTPT